MARGPICTTLSLARSRDGYKIQFTRLIFEATCSPCAIFVLNRCAEDNAIAFQKAVNAIKNHFNMDDYIHSLPSIEQTIETINQTKIAFIKVAFA